jgi:hypothetical protein
MKCAPLTISARAAASAAKEHEEEIAPKAVAVEMLRRFGSPRCYVSLDFGTKAWIIALMK